MQHKAWLKSQFKNNYLTYAKTRSETVELLLTAFISAENIQLGKYLAWKVAEIENMKIGQAQCYGYVRSCDWWSSYLVINSARNGYYLYIYIYPICNKIFKKMKNLNKIK